jgi:hypothetical protein
VVVFGIASVGSGSVSAQVPFLGGGDGRYQEILAEKLGISVEILKAAEKAARDQLIQEAVDAGRLTQEQADRLKNLELGQGRELLKGGPGPFGGFLHAVKSVLNAAAEVIGISEDEVIAGLREGKSLVEIADENGVDRDELKDGLIEKLTEAIEQAEANGRITSQQADRLQSALEEHIDEVIDHEGAIRALKEGGPQRFMIPGRGMR